jgi:peptidoglycan/LPS O-acetylase OafA/YrhL
VRLAAPYIPVEMTPTATLAFHLALAAIVIAITVPLAALSFRFIEAPFQNFGRRLARSISVSSAPRSQSRHV